MTTLAYTVSQKSLTKNFVIQSMERKKIGQVQGRISRRRLVCYPTIQHVIINLYTKYDSSSLQGCGEIFDEKVLRNYGRTDGRTDGMTDRCKPVYPPLFQSGGITTPTRTYCKRSRPLPYSHPNQQDASALEVYPAPSHHPTTPTH